MQLTIARMLGAPPLAGLLPAAVKLSPDGRWVSYLQPGEDDRERLDLWGIDTVSGERRCLVDARTLRTIGNTDLSEEEKARRERKRIFASGLIEYEWSPSSKEIIAPFAGALLLIDPDTQRHRLLTPVGTQQTDATLAPNGKQIAYVRAGDLYVYELESARETRLTRDGSETVSNGLADFIAQEEMHRFEGLWWSPDSQAIAFTRVDSSPIPVSHRHDIEADAIRVVPQRYPYAGAANATVDLHVIHIATQSTQVMAWQVDREDYLARVNWCPDSRSLCVQRQSRSQQRLEVVRVSVDSSMPSDPTVLIEETSESWINLHNNLTLLNDGRLLWTSERDGYSHLYLGDWRSAQVPLRHLTRGDWMIHQLLGVRAASNEVVALGWRDDPCQQHAFAIDLASGAVRPLTTHPGWHQLTLAKNGEVAIDQWSSPNQPPRLDLLTIDSGAAKEIAANAVGEDHPYFPYVDAHATARFATIPAEDGQALHLCVTEPRPPTRVPCPVLLLVYGGPGVTRVRREWGAAWLQFLARQGIAVVQLDNRGSALRGRRFESPIYGQLGDVEVRDQLRAVDWIRQQESLDCTRIAVAGHSYGGYMTLMLMSKAPGVFRAGIAGAPVCDWRLYDTHYTERYLRTPQDNAAGYASSNVLTHLAGLRDPLLLIHGMADDNVLFTHSTQILKALQDQGTPFDFMAYPGSKHGLAEPSVSRHRYEMMFRFLKKHLLDLEDAR